MPPGSHAFLDGSVFVGGYLGNFSVKFGNNWPNGIGEVVI